MTHRYWTLGLLAVLAGTFTARPAAATDQDTFNRLIGKVAPQFTPGQHAKMKVACVCHDPAEPNQPGFVFTDDGGLGQVHCGVPFAYEYDGTLGGVVYCDNFVALGF
jgi:hypothetical protein